MSSILVIGAHYDDAELGAGGTMARLAAMGHQVYKLTLTNNETRFTQKNIQVNYESSVQQSADACRILGVQEVDFAPVQCSHLFYDTEIMQRVEKVVYDLQIDTAFIHYRSDMNQDHVEASRISMTALRHCKNVLMYQSNGYLLEESYYPRFFVDISDTIEKKREALRCYGPGSMTGMGACLKRYVNVMKYGGISRKLRRRKVFMLSKWYFKRKDIS